jgi:hypothetical protein
MTINDIVNNLGTSKELTQEQVDAIIASGIQCSVFDGDSSRKIVFAYRGKVYSKERTERANYILLSPTDDWTSGEY